MALEILGSNLDKVKQELSLSAEEILDDTDPSKAQNIDVDDLKTNYRDRAYQAYTLIVIKMQNIDHKTVPIVYQSSIKVKVFTDRK
jgi:hypothetical protein